MRQETHFRGHGFLVGTAAVALVAACGTNIVVQGMGGASQTTAASTGAVIGSTSSLSVNASSGSTSGAGGAGATSSSTGAGPDCSNGACVGTSPQGNCDSGLAIDSADGMDGARAMGLCQTATNGSWGVKSAMWVRSDGTPLGMGDGGTLGDGDLQLGKGILSGFGANIHPRDGSRLLALSSGSARQPTDAGFHAVNDYWKDFNNHQPPPDFPKPSPSCPGVSPNSNLYDSAGLLLVVQTPKDAKSLSYNLAFYTAEFPQGVCTASDDTFVVLMDPKPTALSDANLSFDSVGNSMSSHTNLLRVCEAQMSGGIDFSCPLGEGELLGTGFEQHGATGWLATTAPIEQPGGEITLLLTVWDELDGGFDSTALIDNFKFGLADAPSATTPD